MSKQFIDVADLANMLSVSVQTIYNNTYKIPGRVKVGNRVRYRISDIEKALQKGKLF